MFGLERVLSRSFLHVSRHWLRYLRRGDNARQEGFDHDDTEDMSDRKRP